MQDSGIGIAAEDFDKLFKPFERLSSAGIEMEGSGLGLLSSRRLVEAMGGKLEVHSVLGEGSTFSVEFAEANVPDQ